MDVLITNVWPSAVTQLSTVPLPSPELESIGTPVLDDVIRRIKPRYHFAAGGGKPPQFWEREPYVWDEEEGRVARFVSLGAFKGEVPTGKKPRVSPSPRPSQLQFIYNVGEVVLRFLSYPQHGVDRSPRQRYKKSFPGNGTPTTKTPA